MLDAYIYDGLRSPFGKMAGALSLVRPDDLLGDVMRALMARSAFKTDQIDDVMIGCGNQGGEDSRCVARHASLVAGFPIEVPGTVLQRNCGSGLNAIISGAHAITCGEADIIVAGGVESMSRAPFVVGKAEYAFERRLESYDSTVGARFPNPKITKEFGDDNLAQTADNLAVEHQLKREDADAFAYRSQSRWKKAYDDGFFAEEVTPITVPGRRKQPDVVVDVDEHPRPQTEMASLTKLRALNPDGITTAGNASGINDGAAAVTVASLAAGEKAGVKPRARVIGSAVAGVPPRTMGYGPVPASKKVLERTGLSLNDMDVIEINEAFAPQVLACLKGLELDFEDERVNPNGGAIAIGHPLGASGPRIALTAINQLHRTGGRYALVTMCIGVGQGIAAIFERV